ncbi:glycosyltransferase [Ignatzschineria indica]|uniref:glycosyltransferase family 4 protein n=1 Tax=Ignatzschineria indica TaxID=472583 RepID=UPI0025766AA2|nr:glycosyltransferase [Ignatzschineria indica]MDM1545270.1 glycosyltransferase [Ignatzschineria indica]
MHITHIITGLNNGGAEAVLYRLCTNDTQAKHTVISLMDMGKYGPLLQAAGIKVHCLNMPAGRVSFAGLRKLYKLLKSLQPDAVQTWMYHADLIGGLVTKFAGIKNIYWNIRHTTLEKGKSKKSTILVAKLCALLSYFIPKRIVCCAHKAVEIHAELGYKKEKMVVIGNGYQLEQFAPNAIASKEIRQELELAEQKAVLGMVGRFNAQKDHMGLLTALHIVKAKIKDFQFLLIGRDLNANNKPLIDKITKLTLIDNIKLLDQRSDIPAVMNALDIHVLSSSFGEAFPNVLAEAMACGTPCVTTDVGDAGLIVGDTGWVVPPKNPQALADGILAAIKEKTNNQEAWQQRQQQCRKRIVENFSIEKMIDKYHNIWSIR